MASDVDICNTALAYLGDTATVASISPPSGSAQSSHCARFYPLALQEMLEYHAWNFVTTRVTLAQASSNPSSSWLYAYVVPSDALNIIAVQAADVTDDYSVGLSWPYSLTTGNTMSTVGGYVPQPYVMSTDSSGNQLILTNQISAVLRYTTTTSTAGAAAPLFVDALARLLAAKLAGPLLKGETGRAESKAQYALFVQARQLAIESDANQRKLAVTHSPSWMASR